MSSTTDGTNMPYVYYEDNLIGSCKDLQVADKDTVIMLSEIGQGILFIVQVMFNTTETFSRYIPRFSYS